MIPIRVGIIGTAGRGDGTNLTCSLFHRMTAAAHVILSHITNPDTPIQLVSGGAAWADHVAVRLFIDAKKRDTENDKGEDVEKKETSSTSTSTTSAPTSTPPLNILSLHLHLPCRFNLSTARAHDTGTTNMRSNPGGVMNALHSSFARTLGITSTMADIVTAHALGAVLHDSHRGFHARNKHVAVCDVLIAFTWGTSHTAPISKGGTSHTWGLCSGTRIHVPLRMLCGTENVASVLQSIKLPLPISVVALNAKKPAEPTSSTGRRRSAATPTPSIKPKRKHRKTSADDPDGETSLKKQKHEDTNN